MMGLFSFNSLTLPAYQPPRDPDEWPKRAEGIRTKFGQPCLWWPKDKGGYHWSNEELEPYRMIGDGPVDKILAMLDRPSDSPSPSSFGPSDDLLKLAEAAAQQQSPHSLSPVEKELASFWQIYQTLPDWVDVEQLRRGQDVFLAFAPIASLSLYYRSLVAGFSIPKIAAVVRSTAYLTPPSRPDQVLQRLFDTGELTATCMGGLGVESILPGGIGWRTALHVRVLHAKVRRALLLRSKQRAWNVEKYGIPINQEDMAATLLGFSVNVLFGIDYVSGSYLPVQDKLDYLALWRYIGWLLGVETSSDQERTNDEPLMSDLPPLDPCGPGPHHDDSVAKERQPSHTSPMSTINNAGSLLQSIIFHLVDPDETSVEVAHHLLKITNRRPPSQKFDKIPTDFYENELFYYRAFQCRRFIGDPLADALGLPLHPKFWIRVKVYLKSTFFLSLFRIYALTSMWVPFLRRRIIQWHRKHFLVFHETWKASHPSKMARALRRNERPSCIVDEDDKHEDGKAADKDETGRLARSVCPFPMVAPPQ